MWKSLVFWLLVVMSSPLIVDFSKDIFQVSGWLAIGVYNFDFAEGFIRSFLYFIITSPVIIAIYLSKPAKLSGYTKKKKHINGRINKFHIYLMLAFCLAAFIFDLGITGVETQTNGWRLSGAVHYIRSYIFLIVIGFYIFGNEKPSFGLIVLYAFVAGLTSGSRFVICSPIALYLLRSFIENKPPTKLVGAVLVLIVAFASVTAERQILYQDDYTFLNILSLYKELGISAEETISRGLNELFMRIGTGRDVILSYEIRDSGVCRDYYRLFFDGGSCSQPDMDFYGFVNDQSRFGIDPPMLASLVASMHSGVYSFILLILYSLWAHILCKAGSFFSRMRSLHFLSWPIYYIQVVFVTIGPVRYAIYIYLSLAIISVTVFIFSWATSNCRRAPGC